MVRAHFFCVEGSCSRRHRASSLYLCRPSYTLASSVNLVYVLARKKLAILLQNVLSLIRCCPSLISSVRLNLTLSNWSCSIQSLICTNVLKRKQLLILPPLLPSSPPPLLPSSPPPLLPSSPPPLLDYPSKISNCKPESTYTLYEDF